jgi:hypothetical protein
LTKGSIVVNTYQLKSVGVPGKKTDKLDAAKLAEKPLLLNPIPNHLL